MWNEKCQRKLERKVENINIGMWHFSRLRTPMVRRFKSRQSPHGKHQTTNLPRNLNLWISIQRSKNQTKIKAKNWGMNYCTSPSTSFHKKKCDSNKQKHNFPVSTCDFYGIPLKKIGDPDPIQLHTFDRSRVFGLHSPVFLEWKSYGLFSYHWLSPEKGIKLWGVSIESLSLPTNFFCGWSNFLVREDHWERNNPLFGTMNKKVELSHIHLGAFRLQQTPIRNVVFYTKTSSWGNRCKIEASKGKGSLPCKSSKMPHLPAS